VYVLILSMRGVPMIDLSGIEAMPTRYEQMHKSHKILLLAGVSPDVMKMIERSGLDALIGRDNFFWSADQAIVAAEERYTCPYCGSAAIPASDLFYAPRDATV
jgi:sulfate permease, SulP family